MSKTALILTVRAQPGRRDELRALWEEHLRPRAEADPAQELYLYCPDADEPDTIRIVEVYGDRQEMQRNATAPWFTEHIGASAPLIAGRPEMVTAEPRWAKGYALRSPRCQAAATAARACRPRRDPRVAANLVRRPAARDPHHRGRAEGRRAGRRSALGLRVAGVRPPRAPGHRRGPARRRLGDQVGTPHVEPGPASHLLREGRDGAHHVTKLRTLEDVDVALFAGWLAQARALEERAATETR